MGTGTKVFFAALAGAAAGLAAGVLYAPDSGKNTRKKINDKSRELADSLEDIAEKGQETINELKKNVEKMTTGNGY